MMRAYVISMTALFLAVAQINAYAADTIWLGTTDNNWQDASNWDNGVPIDGDWGSHVYFGGAATATTITNMGFQAIQSLNFTTAGWTLDGKLKKLRHFNSSGIGTNTITGNLGELYNTATCTIGESNRFVVGGYFYLPNKVLTLTGGGTFEVSKFAGWGSPEVHLTNITCRVRQSTPGTPAVVHLQGDDVTLELLTTVDAARALIGTKIIDGVGNGLAVADIGSGYVSISSMPPLSGSWKGFSGTDFENAGNWVDGPPANNDWQDTTLFAETSPANKTPNLTISRKVKAIDFMGSVGWTLSGSGKTLTLRSLSSTGSGVNTVRARLKSVHSGNTWYVGMGNTLALSGGMYQDSGGSIINLDGGGTLIVSGRIGGGSPTLKMYIVDGVLRVGGSTPYVSGGTAHLNSSTAILELQTTVDAAQALIGTKIIDVVGKGLKVTDIGGGYVRVSSSEPPEPGNWTMTFEDNFDGTYLDPTRWRVGGHWLGIAGIAGNSPENIFVQNGELEILAEKRPVDFGYNSYSYASAEISTFQQFRQKYGYFEARIKYDAVTGAWPAFWTMPDRGNYGWVEGHRESFLRFDLTGISQPITSALLKLKVTSATANGNINVHHLLSDNWNEETLTWNNKPAYAPEWLHQITSPTTGEELVLDVAAYVSLQVNDSENAGFSLVDIYMRDKIVKIASKENSTAAYRPRLVINGVELFPADDAYVRAGTYANNNFGSDAETIVKDPWADTSSTFNGGMEMDITESLGIWGADKAQHALHWDGYAGQHQSTESPLLTLTPTGDGYHVYGMLWEPGRIAMYVDGVMTWEYINSRVCSVDSYIRLSHQMGGWGGNGNVDDNNLPAVMMIDYVRAWSIVPLTAPAGTVISIR